MLVRHRSHVGAGEAVTANFSNFLKLTHDDTSYEMLCLEDHVHVFTRQWKATTTKMKYQSSNSKSEHCTLKRSLIATEMF